MKTDEVLCKSFEALEAHFFVTAAFACRVEMEPATPVSMNCSIAIVLPW